MGKFIVKKVPSGLVFHLKAANGETIGTSEVYNSKEACLNGIASVKKNATAAHIEDQSKEGFETVTCPKFELYIDKGGEFRFRLIAKNGQEILASQAYTAKESCQNGIHSVIKNAPEAVVEEIEAP